MSLVHMIAISLLIAEFKFLFIFWKWKMETYVRRRWQELEIFFWGGGEIRTFKFNYVSHLSLSQKKKKKLRFSSNLGYNFRPKMRLNSIAEQTENRMGQLSHRSAQAHYLDLVEESAYLQSALYYFQLLYESKTINNKFII